MQWILFVQKDTVRTLFNVSCVTERTHAGSLHVYIEAMRKTLISLAVLFSLTLLTSNAQAADTFRDVDPSHLFFEAIEYTQSQRIVSGYPDGTFQPERTINRAEFTKMIIGAQFAASTIGECLQKATLPFSDVPGGAWFSPSVCTAFKRGIISGYNDGTFRPDRSINVAEAAKIVVGAFNLPTGADSEPWYVPFVTSLEKRDAIPSTVQSPSSLLTRGELAFIIWKLHGDSFEENKQAQSTYQVSPLPRKDDLNAFKGQRMMARWYGEEVQHIIPLTQILSGGPTRDGIPSIDEPEFTTIEGLSFLEDDDQGILLEFQNETRFYPFSILNFHEIVNDEIAGTKLVVSYCPLCRTGVIYESRTSTGTPEFGVSGLLYQSNLLMYDRDTESLWYQITGQAVVGPLTGEKLTFVPSNIVRVKTVKESFPHAKVLKGSASKPKPYSTNPYGGYEVTDDVMFPVGFSDRLPAKELIYGIVVNGFAKAYTLEALKREGVIEDTIGRTPVRVTYNPVTEHASFVNAETGEDIFALYSYWFAWDAEYGETEIFE